jgi:hypothetical protein
MLADLSWEDLTASAVAGAAGLDVIVFLAHYPSVAACGAAALDEAAADCRRACAAAFPAWRTCSERFFGMSETVLGWMQDQPAMARLLFVVPEQSHDPGLLERVAAFKRELGALFEQPGRCTPAGRTHVEFVIGLFYQAASQELLDGAEADTVRSRVLALAPFVEEPASSV